MKKIKILYTIPNFETAGSGIALMKLIQGLNKNLFEPHIAVKHTRGAFFENVVAKSGIPVHVLDITKPLTPVLPAIKNIFAVKKFLQKERFDIVYSYNYSSDFYEAIAAKLAGCKWMYIKKNLSWFGYANKWWKIRTLLADHVNSENEYILKEFFHYNPKCSFCPIGVDTNQFVPQEKATELLVEYHIRSNQKVILFVANMVRLKNVETLIKAVKMLENKDPGYYRALIVGGGDEEYVNELKQMVVDENLSEIITFTGKRFDTPKFYSIADILVITTDQRGEAGPVVLLEAMASGVIALGTKVGGMLDRLAEFPDQLCNCFDADELAAKIKKYIHLPQIEKEAIVKRQREIVCSTYSVEKEIERHEALYKQLMKK